MAAPAITAVATGAETSTIAAAGILPPDADDALVIALWLKGKAAETRRAYATDVALFRRWVDRPLRLVTLLDLHSFAEQLVTLEDASLKRRMSAVKSLLSFGHRAGYLPYNVGAVYPLPKLLDDLAERILSEEDVQRMLFAETNRRNHALLRLLYSAGLRVSEVTTLTWTMIHPREDGRAQLTVHGKGTKTRHVLIPAATWSEIQTLPANQAVSAAEANEQPSARGSATACVFASRGANGRRGGFALTTRQVHRIVAAAAKRAGIDKAVSPHWLRHAHASHALDRGAPIHLVRATLGHGSLAITGRYAHARPAASSSDYLPV